MEKILSYFGIVIITSIIFIEPNLYSQIVTGKLVDENGFNLADINLELFISSNVYNTTSLADGSFYFTGVTGVTDDGALPSGYSITNNYPNPFNPKTRLGITLTGDANVRVNIYNILGQKVTGVIQKYYAAGTHFLDIELYGLTSGIYIAQISIDDKYTVLKKMMLVYGSQHLTSTGGTFNSPLNKPNLNKFNISQNIDSLIASSPIIGRKTFTDLQSLSGDTTNLGELTIERFCPGMPTVTYEGKTYNTVQIGDQCWIKENLDVGVMIQSNQNATNNGVIEKYCYNNDPNNCDTYGGLYQWDEAMQYATSEGAQGICPPGWHIPTYLEFETLKATVDNDGNALKEIGQDTISTNTSGFSALFAGGRNGNGSFSGLGYGTNFWSSKEYISAYAYTLRLIDVNSNIYLELFGMDLGLCVRCIKD
ncbi:MAG: T9SS type A sorting domain-containing protein [Ignavibacterium sp.]|nr:T9SS type A sorting domain-containing protein [Ignavibacterium sp.]